MILVGLVSSYKEGPLVQGAVRSCLECCDRVAVFEGPAGDPIEADVPDTDLGEFDSAVSDTHPVYSYFGRWRTDARKRQAMLEWVHDVYKNQPVWGVIVDADEVLINAAYLRDWLQRLDWHEEVNPEAEYVGRPMRLVELDGSVVWVRGRLLRLDRIREYKVSTSIFTLKNGETYRGGGNIPDSFLDWETMRQPYIEQGRMLVQPPIPTEPFLVHRSMLRHPLRSGLRLHEQERAELIAAGLPVD